MEVLKDLARSISNSVIQMASNEVEDEDEELAKGDFESSNEIEPSEQKQKRPNSLYRGNVQAIIRVFEAKEPTVKPKPLKFTVPNSIKMKLASSKVFGSPYKEDHEYTIKEPSDDTDEEAPCESSVLIEKYNTDIDTSTLQDDVFDMTSVTAVSETSIWSKETGSLNNLFDKSLNDDRSFTSNEPNDPCMKNVIYLPVAAKEPSVLETVQDGMQISTVNQSNSVFSDEEDSLLIERYAKDEPMCAKF